MYKVKIIKNSSLQKLEEEINSFTENEKYISKLNVNISILNMEDSITEYIATIIYDINDSLLLN